QPGSIGIDLFCKERHPCYCFQHSTIVYSFASSFTPGKRSMVTYQHHFHFLVVQSLFLEMSQYLVACFMFIVALDLFIMHRGSTGNIYREMISMSSTKDRYIPSCLGPGCSIK